MKKLIITYLLAIAVVLGGVILPAHGAEPVLKSDAELILTGVGVGNICNRDVLSFMLTLRNTNLENKTYSITYKVAKSNGETIENKTVLVSVPAKTVEFRPFSVDLPGYDTYSLDVDVNVGTQLLAQRSAGFAYVKKNEGVNLDLGISTQITNGYDDDAKTIPQMKDAGFGIVRDSIRWERSDNGDGTYTVPAADMEWIDRANAAGMKVILLAWNGHPGYNDGSLPTSEEDLAEIKSYSAQIAKQLKGKIWAYEVWNEPNNQELSTNYHTTTGTQYAAVLKAVYEGIRDVAMDNTTMIIGGALTPLWEGKQDAVTYMREMFDAGAGDYMDGFSFHPYSYDDGAYYDEGNVADNLDTQINYAENILKEYNFDKGIYITEIGASTYDGTTWGVTEQEQAASLSRVAIIAGTDSRVKATTYYTWLEKPSSTSDRKWGMVSNGYSKTKPVYAAMSFCNNILGGIAEREKIEQGVYAYHQKNGGSIFALWSEKGTSENFTITIEGEDVIYESNTITCPEDYIVKVYDMYGNEISGDTITVGEAPVYVSCMPENKANISTNNGMVIVDGIVSDKEKPVTVIAHEAVSGKIVYINQFSADAEGTYQLTFPVDPEIITTVSVYDGEIKTRQGLSNAGEFDIRFYLDDKEILHPADITNGNLRLEVTTSLEQELIAFAALYKSNKALSTVEFDTVSNDSDAILTVPIEDGTEFRFMIWDKELKPILNAMSTK